MNVPHTLPLLLLLALLSVTIKPTNSLQLCENPYTIFKLHSGEAVYRTTLTTPKASKFMDTMNTLGGKEAHEPIIKELSTKTKSAYQLMNDVKGLIRADFIGPTGTGRSKRSPDPAGGSGLGAVAKILGLVPEVAIVPDVIADTASAAGTAARGLGRSLSTAGDAASSAREAATAATQAKWKPFQEILDESVSSRSSSQYSLNSEASELGYSRAAATNTIEQSNTARVAQTASANLDAAGGEGVSAASRGAGLSESAANDAITRANQFRHELEIPRLPRHGSAPDLTASELTGNPHMRDVDMLFNGDRGAAIRTGAVRVTSDLPGFPAARSHLSVDGSVKILNSRSALEYFYDHRYAVGFASSLSVTTSGLTIWQIVEAIKAAGASYAAIETLQAVSKKIDNGDFLTRAEFNDRFDKMLSEKEKNAFFDSMAALGLDAAGLLKSQTENVEDLRAVRGMIMDAQNIRWLSTVFITSSAWADIKGNLPIDHRFKPEESGAPAVYVKDLDALKIINPNICLDDSAPNGYVRFDPAVHSMSDEFFPPTLNRTPRSILSTPPYIALDIESVTSVVRFNQSSEIDNMILPTADPDFQPYKPAHTPVDLQTHSRNLTVIPVILGNAPVISNEPLPKLKDPVGDARKAFMARFYANHKIN